MINMELPSDDYILGLVKGEGCFSCSIEKYRGYRGRKTKKRKEIHHAFPFRVLPSFRIGLAKKDAKILSLIRKKLGYGQIHTSKISKKNKNLQDYCQYYVQTRKDLYKVAAYFRGKTFYATKGKDFEIWLKILEIIKNEKHPEKEGFIEICELRDQMNKMKGKTRKRKTKKIKSILENPPPHRFPKNQNSVFIHN